DGAQQRATVPEQFEDVGPLSLSYYGAAVFNTDSREHVGRKKRHVALRGLVAEPVVVISQGKLDYVGYAQASKLAADKELTAYAATSVELALERFSTLGILEADAKNADPFA
ncbi:unnamed protein product, partial [Prorocentrum cordatum]